MTPQKPPEGECWIPYVRSCIVGLGYNLSARMPDSEVAKLLQHLIKEEVVQVKNGWLLLVPQTNWPRKFCSDADLLLPDLNGVYLK